MNVLKKDQAQMMLQVIVAVLLFRFVLFESLIDDLGLSVLHYFAFLIAIGFILYGGVLLYKIVLQEEFPDKSIEKSVEKAYYKYLGFNAVGIGISFFAASDIDRTYYFGFFLGLAAILYLYITQWRKILVFDNIVYSLINLVSFFYIDYYGFNAVVTNKRSIRSYERSAFKHLAANMYAVVAALFHKNHFD